MKIEVWGREAILLDDLIGYTKIDLENRYFSDDWHYLIHKPVEVRPLLNAKSWYFPSTRIGLKYLKFRKNPNNIFRKYVLSL